MAGLFSAKSMSKDVPNRKEIIRISITTGFCSVGFVGIATTAKRKPKHHAFDSTVPKKGTKTTVLSNPRSQGRSVCDFNDFAFCTSCLCTHRRAKQRRVSLTHSEVAQLNEVCGKLCRLLQSRPHKGVFVIVAAFIYFYSVFRVFMIPTNTTSIDAWNNAKNKRQ